ncbi:MAG: flippase [Candidatus Omnitrophota bacterium]|jgi:O-antigen/teichoic acid export membrane protein
MLFKKTIAKNTVFNFIGKAVQILVAVITTPIIIKHLGINLYGVWVLLSAITNYYGLFDFGLSGAYIKYISEYKAKEDWNGLKEVVATGFYSSLLIGLVIYFLGYLFRNQILVIVVKNNKNIPNISLVYLGTLLLFCFAYIGQFFQSILNGYQRMELTNISIVVQRLLNFILIVFFLSKNLSLIGLVSAGLVSWVVLIIINVYQTKRIFKQFSLSLINFSKIKFLILMKFGWKMQITSVAGWMLNNLDKIFLGYFTNTAVVTLYDVAYKIRNFSREPITSYLSTVTPVASEMHAKEDLSALKSFYMQYNKYLLIILFPIVGFILSNSANLIKLWVGSSFEVSIVILNILMIGNILNLLTGCGTSIARGINRPEIEAKYTALMTFLTIILGYFLTKYYGIKGIAWGSSISLGIPSVLFIFIFNNYLQINNRDFFDKIIKVPLIAAFLVFGFDYILNYFYVLNSKSLHTYVFLIAKFIILALIYFIILIKFKYASFSFLKRKFFKSED